jgi:hypothetical protein
MMGTATLGMDARRALSMRLASLEFSFGFTPPPVRTATAISRESFRNTWLRLASSAALACLMLDHLLCPAISRTLATRVGGKGV